MIGRRDRLDPDQLDAGLLHRVDVRLRSASVSVLDDDLLPFSGLTAVVAQDLADRIDHRVVEVDARDTTRRYGVSMKPYWLILP